MTKILSDNEPSLAVRPARRNVIFATNTVPMVVGKFEAWQPSSDYKVRTYPHRRDDEAGVFMAREITSKNIDGITDLVVWAPIKEGFIYSPENVTYDTRARIVAEALHKVRLSAREFENYAVFSDTSERILTLLDFRIGIADSDLFQANFEGRKAQPASLRPRKYMYVVATFDGPLEPYMRLIWDPLGPFLDLVLCNCEGYLPATENSFPDYIKWVREHQLDSAIFYSTTGMTIREQVYLRKLEKIQRGALPNDPAIKKCPIEKMTLDDPEVAASVRRAGYFVEKPLKAGFDINRLALEALTVLYKLADYYPPDRLTPETPDEAAAAGRDRNHPNPGDGRFLLRASQSLLKEWNPALLPPTSPARLIYKEPLAWFSKDVSLPKMEARPDPVEIRQEVQAGILQSYDTPAAPTTDGALLLMQVTDPAKARAFLKAFHTSWQGEATPADGIYRNLAFTFAGLKRLGLPRADLLALPKEFREGMEDRAGQMGDLRENHPRSWALPERNWPPVLPGTEPLKRPPVELSEVDFVIQLRTSYIPPEKDGLHAERDFNDFHKAASDLFFAAQTEAQVQGFMESDGADSSTATHPLTEVIAQLGVGPAETGVQLVAVESMFRVPSGPASANDPYPDAMRDHFGFKDGISQPEHDFNIGDGPVPQNHARIGELLLGYRNDRHDYAPIADSPAPEVSPFPAYFTNSTFLVIRKIAQHTDRFEALISQGTKLPSGIILDKEETAARIVGRYRDGRPLIGTGDNSFNYTGDKEGVACPFASHIRRTNPRTSFQGRPSPRILRRGMSYGTRFDSNDAEASAKVERGIMFMAYNASIAEQFETIQSWINGGNSTDVSSAQNDPLVGTNPRPTFPPEKRIFRFVHRTANDATTDEVASIEIKEPLTSLRWGVYLFVPSKSAMNFICDSERVNHTTTVQRQGDAESGEDIIAEIKALPVSVRGPAWKSILEDFQSKDPTEKSLAPDVWQAIRDIHDGIYRLPFKAIPSSGNNDNTFSGGLETASHPVTTGIFKKLKSLFAQSSAVIEAGADKLATAAGLTEQEFIDVNRLQYTLIASDSLVKNVLSDKVNFSVSEQGDRFRKSIGDIYVSIDPGRPDKKYETESLETNKILFKGGNDQDYVDAYNAAYAIGSTLLARTKRGAESAFAPLNEKPFFKLELRRQYLMPVLGELCRLWFDIPDSLGGGTDPLTGLPTSAFIENGPWGWAPPWMQKDKDKPGMRMPRCPADFLSESRDAFNPRPTSSITYYAGLHGKPLRDAADALVARYQQDPSLVKGSISKPMFEKIKNPDLLVRNLLGLMVGMLPPTEGNLRAILFDWLAEKTLWQHQAALRRVSGNKPATYEQAEAAIGDAVRSAIMKRPAPDLIYRTAKKTIWVGTKKVRKGDKVILSLVSAVKSDGGGIAAVFGGDRTSVPQPDGAPIHACPARRLAMGSMLGIIAALLDSGRIQAQPASLIVRINDWK
jgi:Dyp-type peroxidase family